MYRKFKRTEPWPTNHIPQRNNLDPSQKTHPQKPPTQQGFWHKIVWQGRRCLQNGYKLMHRRNASTHTCFHHLPGTSKRPYPSCPQWCNFNTSVPLYHPWNRTSNNRVPQSPSSACEPLYYSLSKVHKCNTPLRPLLSAHDSPTENIPKFVTYFIEPLAEHLPAYYIR